MSETKHTPGPWAALPEESDKPYVRVRGTQLGRRYKVANVLKPIYDGAHEIEAEETAANALLIAAAPSLMFALELLLENVEEPPERNCSCHISPPCSDCVDHSGLREALNFARLAIAKATGA